MRLRHWEELRWMSRSAFRSIVLASTFIAIVLPQTRASPISSYRIIHASNPVEPRTSAVLQRHSGGISSVNITHSSPIEVNTPYLSGIDSNLITLAYSSDIADGSAPDVQRELFSAPTVAPSAAIVCQAGDEDFDAILGCSFDDSTDNNG